MCLEFLGFFFVFLVPLGPGMAPKCGPGDRLSNRKVSSKSGQWRPDSWQKYVLNKSQMPTIVGANYTNRKVNINRLRTFSLENRKLSVRFLGLFGPPWAPGWPETDSPRKMVGTSGVETRIRALGTPFVTIFRFWKNFWSTTPP